jgi:hypothetical protein
LSRLGVSSSSRPPVNQRETPWETTASCPSVRPGSSKSLFSKI